MAQFTLSITLGNDAMQTGGDIVEALQKILPGIAVGATKSGVWDINGNRVGEWRITE